MATEAYEERIVAFADILGWSDATEDESKFSLLLETLRSIAEHAAAFSPTTKEALRNARGLPEQSVAKHAEIEFTHFSDSFAVSAPLEYCRDVFKILSFASDKLLRRKFLVRGGVTKGKLLHNDKIIFGPALVQAVKIEKRDALYPRFLCNDALITYLDGAGYKHKVVVQDFSQSWVANIACGSSIARDELMRIIEDYFDPSESVMRKWRYLQEMLPKMYAA